MVLFIRMGNFVEKTFRSVAKRCGYNLVPLAKKNPLAIQYGAEAAAIIASVQPYTMTGPPRLYALIQAVQYVVANRIPGDIVECGVWKGGSMMAVAQTLLQTNSTERHLHLFDTFEGMTPPKEIDASRHGVKAAGKFKERQTGGGSDWCYAPLEAVQQALYSTGYDPAKLHFIKGRVEDTIPTHAPPAISILRLDTDWYESTRHELVHLFPRLAQHGVLIIDDYDYWDGSRKATDEYLSQNNLCLLLNKIDDCGRMAVRT